VPRSQTQNRHRILPPKASQMKKPTLLLAVVALVGVSTILVVFTSRKEPTPKSVTTPTLDSVINVHGSPEQGLRICGKTFRKVKGGPPYYLVVPSTSLVLLAYESFPGGKSLVVCNTNDCTFREIPLGEIVFGNQIGYWTATKGEMGDTIESVSSNRVALLSKGLRYTERSELDLNNYTIHVVEVQSERNRISLDIWTNQEPHATNPK